MTANVERLKQLRDWFALVPEHKVNMATVFKDRNHDGNNESFSCMTAGCLWGWASVYKPFVEAGLRLDSDLTIFGLNRQCCTDFGAWFGTSLEVSEYLCQPDTYRDEMINAGIYTNVWTFSEHIPKSMVMARLDAVIAANGEMPVEALAS